MRITKDNYEAWFLDYHEGNLDEKKAGELFSFLEKHPELKEEFDSFEMIRLNSGENSFSDKRLLKKEITAANEEEYLFAYTENMLNTSDRLLVEEYVQSNPAGKKELRSWELAKLPNENIVFFGKERLKKRDRKPVPAYIYIGAAASLALLLGFFYFNQDGKPGTTVSGFQFSVHQFPKTSVSDNPVSGIQYPLSDIQIQNPKSGIPNPKEPVLQKEDHPYIVFHPEEGRIDTNYIVITENPSPKDSSFTNANYYPVEEDSLGRRFLLLDLINFIGKGISKLTGKEFKLKKEVDDEGGLSAYEISYGKLVIQKENNQKPLE